MIAAMVVAFAGYRWVMPRIDQPRTLDLSIDVPYVAPGIRPGAKVIVRGNEVGEVSSLTRFDDSSIRMGLALRPTAVKGLTDNFGIDFRPANYFGVTALNLVGRPGGGHVVSGQVFDRRPAGDYSMSTMIEKGSLVVSGTLTDSMIQSLDKIIRYTDGLTPLIQTGVVLANRVAQTQQAMPSVLLADMNRILDVVPYFSSQFADTLYNLYDSDLNRLPDGSFGVDDAVMTELDQGLDLAGGGLFGAAGTLVSSHPAQLLPVTQMVAALSDAVPNLLGGGAAASKLSTLVDRYNGAFTGPVGHKALNLRIVLDDLPAMATPLALTGLPPTADQEAGR